MVVQNVFDEIQLLENLIYKINIREKEAIAELNRLHKIVYGEKVNTTCSNCHIKAYKKLLSLTILDLENMENQKFKLKKDALVSYPAHSGTHFTLESGIPDDIATKLLTDHPKLVKHFDKFPTNEAGELELKSLPAKSDLSRLNKEDLQAKYKEVLGEDAAEELTKKELIEKIEAKKD